MKALTMKALTINVAAIKVVERHRRDMGDVQGLADSIADIGLLNPITVTPELRLVAGGRRLEAYRLLGRGTIPARTVESLADAAAALRAERDENTCRKDMLPSELAALGEALYEVEAAVARKRQRQAGREHGRGIASSSQGESYPRPAVEAAVVVGEALGMSRSTYAELRFAHKVATDPDRPDGERDLGRQALDEMDRRRAIQPVVRKLRADLRAKQEAQEVKKAALSEPPPEPVPAGNARDPQSAVRRRELIREMAGKGCTSGQIAERLGLAANSVRRIAKEEGIAIPTDELLGRSRKAVDSNRIVRETVTSLEGLELALSLVRHEELDQAEIKNWTTSLTASIKLLRGLKNQLENQLKGMVQ